MSDFDLCKETLVGKRIIFLGSSVTYGACAMGQSFIEALEEKDGIIAIKEAVSGTLLVDEDVADGKSYPHRLERRGQIDHAEGSRRTGQAEIG